MLMGLGYDVHKLVKGRKLILGGVNISHTKGLLGHSDADVLVHAVMDALLGAAGMQDIGHLFPNTSPKYKNADSLTLLKEVVKKLSAKKLAVNNIDVSLVCEKPKIAPYPFTTLIPNLGLVDVGKVTKTNIKDSFVTADINCL